MRAVELGTLGELMQQDGGRAHGERAAHHHGRRPGDTAAQPGEQCEYRRGRGDLRRPQAEDFAPHGDQARQRELEAEREEEEYDAELGEGPGGRGAGHHGERVGAQRQTHEKVRDGRRQPEPPGHGDQQHRDGEEDQDLSERLHGPILCCPCGVRGRPRGRPRTDRSGC